MTKSVAVRVGVHEAKTRLSELLRLVDSGQEVEIARGGEPVAKLVPFHTQDTRRLGIDRGVYTVPDDFDAPLPDNVLESFHR
ncbi:antitoxin [Mycobacterium intermedium]|uniref:Antitoxin n=1 Tax=Mycobacterium intermedium TaxID=28445 RepID=A0A1E3SIP9_MYCIE|nr:type II toxin-antitoxin system prevent-host-death family antitoxin [Mycobacterium intermedium]MCV6967163.1 type II toxin-antitoxin system Phd/YefM family antitoxin [Mycobacterium intermedium]ODR01991.1 antitoxin [Mycobacterium intermedium]OPE49218.1 antitoxin [Mycobacterium intermedium]ORA97047.1 antitoxin [Mycobacterium intermedium]